MTKDNPCLGICPGKDKKKGCMKSTRILSQKEKDWHWYRGENGRTKLRRRQAPCQASGKLGVYLHTKTPSVLQCSSICGLPRKAKQHRTPSLTCIAWMSLVIPNLLFRLAKTCQLLMHKMMNDALLHFIAIVTSTCRVRLNNQTWFEIEAMPYKLHVALLAYHP